MIPGSFPIYRFAGLGIPLPGGLRDTTVYEFKAESHALRSVTLESLSLPPTHAPQWLVGKRERIQRVPRASVTKIQRTTTPRADLFAFNVELVDDGQRELTSLCVACFADRAVALSTSGSPEHRALLHKIYASVAPTETPSGEAELGYTEHTCVGARIALPTYLIPPQSFRFESYDLKLVGNVGYQSIEPRREDFLDVGIPIEAVVAAARAHPREVQRDSLDARGAVEEFELVYEAEKFDAAIGTATFTYADSAVTVQVRGGGSGKAKLTRWWRSLIETTFVI